MWAALFEGLFSSADKQAEVGVIKDGIHSSQNIAFFNALSKNGRGGNQALMILLGVGILGVIIFIALKK
jgi:hypothetical protein